MQLRCFRCACLRKHMSMHQTYYLSCEFSSLSFSALLKPCCVSADLEITVPLLVQIDKLVQLIESPVFTCEYL